MDKNKKIILAASVTAVAVIIGAVALTQGSRLKTAASVAKSATMNEEQVTAKSDENEQITQELQDQYQIPEIALTPEMEAAIADGSMTVEEAAAQFLSGGAAETPNAENAAQASETATDAPETVTETSQPSAPENVTAVPEPSQPESVVSMPEPSAPENATPMPEPSQPESATPAPESEKPKAEEKPSETASLSGETDDRQAEADAGKTEAPKTDAGRSETPKADGEPSEPPKAPETDSGQAQAPEKSAEEKAQEERDAKVQNLFAQLYVLKNSFSNRVDAIINECIEEFLALDSSKQTKVAKIRIVYARMDDFEAMEADCNAQVENIASQLDEIDPALGEKARQYYQNEKELKKSSLISQYGN